jgi:hypothetical protein
MRAIVDTCTREDGKTMNPEKSSKRSTSWREYVETDRARVIAPLVAGLFVCVGVGLLLVGLLLIGSSAFGEEDLGVILVLCGCFGIGLGISCFKEVKQRVPIALTTQSSVGQTPELDNMVSRSRWKSLTTPVAVLVGVVGVCLFLCKMRERKEFVSNVINGYRFRCTLSTDWKPTEVFNMPPGLIEEAVFFARPPLIQEWIVTHVCHQSPSTLDAVYGQQSLQLEIETGKVIPGMFLQDGYPELDPRASETVASTILPSRHYRIDGCLATMTGYDTLYHGRTLRYTILLVCTPDYRSEYTVMSYSTPERSDLVDPEMQAILTSFHVEKVVSKHGQ